MTATAISLGSLVGLSLGLTGGGGSIFAVPLLVYGLSLNFREAVALSLAIVGTTALYGASLQARRGVVLWGAGAVLGVGGILTAPLGAYVGDLLPDQLSILMFAVLMLVIGAQMVRNKAAQTTSSLACDRNALGELSFSWPCAIKLFITGTVTGLLSGIFGVGGGFLLVPALLMVGGISIDSAMATSLVSITLISLSGFVSNLAHITGDSAPTAIWFLVGALGGMTIGASLKARLPTDILRRIFGVMIIATALALFALNIF